MKRRFRRKNPRRPLWVAATGLAVGSALAYLLRHGDRIARRRDAAALRARLRARLRRSALIEELGPTPDYIDDEMLLELARSELRRCCSYPGAITLSCAAGVVRLEGPVLKSELNRVLRAVSRLPGVKEIHDHLEAHRYPWDFGAGTSRATPGNVSSDRGRDGRPVPAPG
jgi:hypothetical protein